MRARTPAASLTEAALARLYDVDLLDDPGDADMYLALARRAGGPVLELGVGSGRLAVALARAGFRVTGVDRDRAMLDRANRRAAATGSSTADRLELVQADIDGLRLPRERTFQVGFIGLNSLMLLASRRAQAAAIRTLADHVGAGGLVVADVWLPDADDLSRHDGRLILEYIRPDPESGRTIVKIAAAVHDPATATIALDALYDEVEPGTPAIRWLRHDRLRLVSADELRVFAEEAGLTVELIAGGYDLAPLAAGSDRAILVATRP